MQQQHDSWWVNKDRQSLQGRSGAPVPRHEAIEGSPRVGLHARLARAEAQAGEPQRDQVGELMRAFVTAFLATVLLYCLAGFSAVQTACIFWAIVLGHVGMSKSK